MVAPAVLLRRALLLDELAKHASVPLLGFAAVWLAGAVLLARWARLERLTAALGVGIGTLAVVYLTSGVSIAVTRQIALRDALRVAARLNAVYIPAVLVGALVAALALPHQVTAGRATAIVAMLVAADAQQA